MFGLSIILSLLAITLSGCVGETTVDAQDYADEETMKKVMSAGVPHGRWKEN